MYDSIQADDGSLKTLMEIVRRDRQTSYGGMFESSFEPAEIHQDIQTGGRKEAPGNDGLGREIYPHHWALIRDDLFDIIKQMFWTGYIMQNQKRRVIICLRKARGNQTLEEYRPNKIISSDYKILARVVVQSVCPVLADRLSETQYCGLPGNTILDAVTTVRGTIAYAESRMITLFVLTLDFKNAFYRIAQSLFFQTP